MTTLVVLTVVELVLLVAGLAAYLWIVGGQLTTVASTLEECDELVATIERNAAVITPGVEHINRTGAVIAGALPLLYGMAESIVAGADLPGSGARCRASPGHAGRRHPPFALPRSSRVPTSLAPARLMIERLCVRRSSISRSARVARVLSGPQSAPGTRRSTRPSTRGRTDPRCSSGDRSPRAHARSGPDATGARRAPRTCRSRA